MNYSTHFHFTYMTCFLEWGQRAREKARLTSKVLINKDNSNNTKDDTLVYSSHCIQMDHHCTKLHMFVNMSFFHLVSAFWEWICLLKLNKQREKYIDILETQDKTTANEKSYRHTQSFFSRAKFCQKSTNKKVQWPSQRVF